MPSHSFLRIRTQKVRPLSLVGYSNTKLSTLVSSLWQATLIEVTIFLSPVSGN
ncbi:hypothetical protein M404DRAFT_1009451, partial [Pisolithus tinctorius Marx 270]